MEKKRKYLPAAIIGILMLCGLPIGVVKVPAQSNESGNHDVIPCFECHTLLASLDDSDIRGFDRGEKCGACHTPYQSADERINLGFHYGKNRKCSDCHSFHKPEVLTAAGTNFNFDYRDNSLSSVCFACHNMSKGLENLSDGHSIAASIYHKDYQILKSSSPSSSCLSCHGSRNAADDQTKGMNPPVFNEKASHPYGIYLSSNTPGSEIGLNRQVGNEIILFDGKIECQTCHNLLSGNANYLRYNEPDEKFCLGCHNKKL